MEDAPPTTIAGMLAVNPTMLDPSQVKHCLSVACMTAPCRKCEGCLARLWSVGPIAIGALDRGGGAVVACITRRLSFAKSRRTGLA